MQNNELSLPKFILETPNFFILICNYFTEIETFDITKVNNIFFDNNKHISFTLLLVLDQHIDYIKNEDCYAYLAKFDDTVTEYSAFVNIAQFSLNPDSNKQRMEHCDRDLPPGPKGEVLPYARQTFIIPLKDFPTLGPGVYEIIISNEMKNNKFVKIYSKQKFTIIPTSMSRVK